MPDVSKIMSCSKSFTPDEVTLDESRCARAVTRESVDYSDGRKAAILSYFGGHTGGGSELLINTGWAPFVDPGFSGNLFGVVTGTEMLRKVRMSDTVLTLYEYDIKGNVDRLYRNKNLGSRY